MTQNDLECQFNVKIHFCRARLSRATFALARLSCYLNVKFIARRTKKQMHQQLYPQSTLRLYVHNSQTSLIENSIANVFTRLRVGGHLKQLQIQHTGQ